MFVESWLTYMIPRISLSTQTIQIRENSGLFSKHSEQWDSCNICDRLTSVQQTFCEFKQKIIISTNLAPSVNSSSPVWVQQYLEHRDDRV